MKKSILVFLVTVITSCHSNSQNGQNLKSTDLGNEFEITKSDEEWKEELGEEAFNVLRNKGTEYAFKGKYYDFKKKGIYVCNGCGNKLFDSETKYNSGSGWPSFYAPFSKKSLLEVDDNSLGVKRTELVCSKCGGHLGHVFPDGPKPTGMRYCVNSISLEFKEEK